MNYPKTLENLINCYKKLPGIGEKMAERMAFFSLSFDQETIDYFSQSLVQLKKKIRRCNTCHNLCETDTCEICENKNRNKNIICIVEEPKNIFQIEKIGSYNGIYHVLDGLISPLDDVNPEDLNISDLINRIEKEKINEVIIAVRPSIEGETTSLYISKLLENKNVVVSKIAHGVPLGADMEYVDSLTLEMALEDRKIIVNPNELDKE